MIGFVKLLGPKVHIILYGALSVSCSIGDFGTIYYFQITPHSLSVILVMLIAVINGIITSIILETIILFRQKFKLIEAFKIACGMSLISMISMELAMNLTDYLIVGSAKLVWWVVPIMLIGWIFNTLAL